MAEQPSRSDVIRRWVDAHADEIDALVYGRVEFVFTNGAPTRVKLERSEQLQANGPRLSA